jgi:hypothetical protein
MAPFAFGFRDTLEAAFMIALTLVALVRLGRGHLAQALWIGVGAGALMGFSIATGLTAGEVAATGAGWTAFEIAAMALGAFALVGVALTARRFSAESGPAAWLAVAAGLFATLPQVLDLMTRVAGNTGGVGSLALMGVGAALAAGVAALLAAALLRSKPAAPAPKIVVEQPAQPVSGELASIPQRAD